MRSVTGILFSLEARSRKQEARTWSVELKAVGEHKHCTNPFWLLTSGFHIRRSLAGYQGRSPCLVSVAKPILRRNYVITTDRAGGRAPGDICRFICEMPRSRAVLIELRASGADRGRAFPDAVQAGGGPYQCRTGSCALCAWN
jgi:hypothetical protein